MYIYIYIYIYRPDRGNVHLRHPRRRVLQDLRRRRILPQRGCHADFIFLVSFCYSMRRSICRSFGSHKKQRGCPEMYTIVYDIIVQYSIRYDVVLRYDL